MPVLADRFIRDDKAGKDAGISFPVGLDLQLHGLQLFEGDGSFHVTGHLSESVPHITADRGHAGECSGAAAVDKIPIAGLAHIHPGLFHGKQVFEVFLQFAVESQAARIFVFGSGRDDPERQVDLLFEHRRHDFIDRSGPAGDHDRFCLTHLFFLKILGHIAGHPAAENADLIAFFRKDLDKPVQRETEGRIPGFRVVDQQNVFHYYIFSGAPTPIRYRPCFRIRVVTSVRYRRAWRVSSSSVRIAFSW